MPTWLPPSAVDQPSVVLSSWTAFEVLIPRLGRATMHVAGWASDEAGARVSSPVLSVDVEKRCVRTRSGRVYGLEGAPSAHPDVAYLVDQWVEGYGAEAFVDTSLDLEGRFGAAD